MKPATTAICLTVINAQRIVQAIFRVATASWTQAKNATTTITITVMAAKLTVRFQHVAMRSLISFSAKFVTTATMKAAMAALQIVDPMKLVAMA